MNPGTAKTSPEPNSVVLLTIGRGASRRPKRESRHGECLVALRSRSTTKPLLGAARTAATDPARGARDRAAARRASSPGLPHGRRRTRPTNGPSPDPGRRPPGRQRTRTASSPRAEADPAPANDRTGIAPGGSRTREQASDDHALNWASALMPKAPAREARRGLRRQSGIARRRSLPGLRRRQAARDVALDRGAQPAEGTGQPLVVPHEGVLQGPVFRVAVYANPLRHHGGELDHRL